MFITENLPPPLDNNYQLENKNLVDAKVEDINFIAKENLVNQTANPFETEPLKKMQQVQKPKLNDLFNKKSTGISESQLNRKTKYKKENNEDYRLMEENNEIKKEKYHHYYLNIKKTISICIKHLIEMVYNLLQHSYDFFKFTFKCLNEVAFMSLNFAKELNIVKHFTLIIGQMSKTPSIQQTQVIKQKIINYHYHINHLHMPESKA